MIFQYNYYYFLVNHVIKNKFKPLNESLKILRVLSVKIGHKSENYEL